MTGLDALRRVVARAQAGKPLHPEDLDALAAVVVAIDAGTAADKALGLKRAKAGRPKKPRYALADLEQVMLVLENMDNGQSQEDAVYAAVGGDTSKEDTLARKVRKYRRLARYLLDEEATPDDADAPTPTDPRADFLAP